jgi:hypothetical protein
VFLCRAGEFEGGVLYVGLKHHRGSGAAVMFFLDRRLRLVLGAHAVFPLVGLFGDVAVFLVVCLEGNELLF